MLSDDQRRLGGDDCQGRAAALENKHGRIEKGRQGPRGATTKQAEGARGLEGTCLASSQVVSHDSGFVRDLTIVCATEEEQCTGRAIISCLQRTFELQSRRVKFTSRWPKEKQKDTVAIVLWPCLRGKQVTYFGRWFSQ